jgi:hypothetical protein
MSVQSKRKRPEASPEDLAAADVDLSSTALVAFEKIKGNVGEDKDKKKEVLAAFQKVFEDVDVQLVNAPNIVCYTFLSLMHNNDTLFYFRKQLSQVLG